MKRRYWVVSPNVSNKSVDEPIWKKIITENEIAFMGWKDDHDLGYKFKNEIRKGDFILIAQGGNQNKRLFIGGIVSSNAIWETYPNTPEEAYNRFLNPCLSKSELESLHLNFTDSAYGAAERIPSLYELHPNRNVVDKIIVDRIEFALKIKTQEQNMQDKIDILEYKKQIILQGPPGTGKTRLAKMMAEKMTQVEKKSSPIQLINDYFKSYIPNDKAKEQRIITDTLINEFIRKFMPHDIGNLSLEEYALGREEKDGFCYWLEYVLTSTGKYNGPADKGKIYFNKEGTYIKSGFLKDIEDDNEAMKKMAEVLDKIINEKFEEGIEFPVSKFFVLKILNAYYPEIYFPINSEHCLNNVLKIFNEDYSKLNYLEKNRKVQSLFLDKKKEFNCDITNYEFMYFLFNNFNLKKEVKLENNELVIEGKYKIIQFHPAYSYEDFVRGITAKTNEKGDVNYKVENRILVEFANEAMDNPKGSYVLIIDEINRANLPSVLGELIYALEYRYNYGKDNKQDATVESVYNISEVEVEVDRNIMLPENLYIIGTMNTADRSVGHIDYAIKRRFAFVDVLPTDKAIDDAVTDAILNKKAKDLYKKVEELFNEDSNKSVYLQSDFKAKDVQLGHSYFLAETEKQLELKLEFEIKPLLNEYVKDGILSEDAVKEIKAL